MTHKRTDSKYRSRGHIHEERSSATATRTPAKRKPVDPQVQEVKAAQNLYFAANSAARRGECAYPRMADYCLFVDGKMVVTEFAKKLLAEMAVVG